MHGSSRVARGGPADAPAIGWSAVTEVVLPPARTLVTGGAGFIGSVVVERLLDDGCEVTILDDLSTAAPGWRAVLERRTGWSFVRGRVEDPAAVDQALAGCERVIHLAASTDIAGGLGRPERDFTAGVVGTQVLCTAMYERGLRDLWFASSGVVYGWTGRRDTILAEGDGPYRPASHYAAAKLAGEALISGFAHLYGWRALAFRFGNTVGPRSDHGVVHDLVVKLLRDPGRLELLGDGRQAKPYIHVDDLVAAMRHAAGVAHEPLTILNLGPRGTLSVDEVAGIVIEALGLDDAAVERRYSGGAEGGGGWVGDTPYLSFDTSAMERTGWRPRRDARTAVRDAARAIAASYRDRGAPLLTASERRAQLVAQA